MDLRDTGLLLAWIVGLAATPLLFWYLGARPTWPQWARAEEVGAFLTSIDDYALGELVLRTLARLVWLLWAWIAVVFVFRLVLPPRRGQTGGGGQPC